MTGASAEGEAGNKDGLGSIIDTDNEGSFPIMNHSTTLGKGTCGLMSPRHYKMI